jgi:hypothetical protein
VCCTKRAPYPLTVAPPRDLEFVHPIQRLERPHAHGKNRTCLDQTGLNTALSAVTKTSPLPRHTFEIHKALCATPLGFKLLWSSKGMELGSYFLFLQEQITDIMIISFRRPQFSPSTVLPAVVGGPAHSVPSSAQTYATVLLAREIGRLMTGDVDSRVVVNDHFQKLKILPPWTSSPLTMCSSQFFWPPSNLSTTRLSTNSTIGSLMPWTTKRTSHSHASRPPVLTQ